jgi:phage portal protein BeeE
MGWFERITGTQKSRAEPQKRNALGVFMTEECGSLAINGYTSLSENPEVKIAVNQIANLVSSMTIHLMKNTEDGDVRVINRLSEKIDISPYSLMTRKDWVYNIVNTMLLKGEGNAIVYPKFENGLIEELIPLPPNQISLMGNGTGYEVRHNGVIHNYDSILHFTINPNPEQPWRGTAKEFLGLSLRT